MWKKIVRPKLSVGFLPLLEMSLKMGQLCGMQAAIQLHQMARNSVFKKSCFFHVHLKFRRFEYFEKFRRDE